MRAGTLPAMRNLILAAMVAMFALAGCGDDTAAKGKKLGALCVEAGNQLAAGGADDETFQLQLQNALTACSGACDAKDDASCKALNEHVNKICGVSDGMCKGLCEAVKSPSLKKATCEFKKP